jgi:hypothetical protein
MTEDQTTEIAIDTTQRPEDSSLPQTLGQVQGTDNEATQEALSKSRYTLSTIQRRRPKLLELAIRLLSEGCSQRETAETTGLCRPVIAQIRTQYEEQIGNLRDESATKARNIAAQTLDLMMEKVEDGDIPPNLLPIYFGVLTEKAELLSGQATSRQEIAHTDNRIPIEELYASLRRSDPANIDISTNTD